MAESEKCGAVLGGNLFVSDTVLLNFFLNKGCWRRLWVSEGS